MDTTTKKCVVWDLDNTVWEGTLLEGDEPVLNAGAVEVIRELDRRGILQSIASKNDYEMAWERLKAFGLDEYFLHPQIGWWNKSDSIRNIAEKLGISTDTFVFIDDRAFERDEVRYSLPEVVTVAADDIHKLLEMACMLPRFVTEESRVRRKAYQADILRKRLEEEFPGAREDFLATLGTIFTVRAAVQADLRRAEELTVRTNQLNTTGRSYSYEELESLLDSPRHLLLVTDLEDRYGSSGTIGLALIEREQDQWLVKLLLMSCRVMTRGVGGILISYILQAAKGSGIRLRAEFSPNERNRMMYMTFKMHGFYEVATRNDCIVLEHDLEIIRPIPVHVTVR